MRRLPIFVLLGPFLCTFTFIAAAWLAFRAGPFDEGGQVFLSIVFGGYGITLPFMLAIAYLDRRLARHRWRVLICAVVGFALATAFVYGLAWEGGSEEQFEKFRRTWFFTGLVIGLPAAVCSWLAGKYAPEPSQRR